MADDAGSRWMGVGLDAQGDSAAAGAAAASAALAGRIPKALLVFATHTAEAEAMLDAVASVAGDVPLIGCTTSGEIAAGRAHHGTVTVVAIGGDGIEASVSAVDDVHVDAGAAAEAVCAGAIPVADLGHRAMVVLVDGMISAKRDFASGAYAALGLGTKLVGGGAGDGMTNTVTRQFVGTSVLTRGAVALGLTCEAPFGVGVGFGFESSGTTSIVTEVSGDWIVSLDHRPALEVYLERVAGQGRHDNDRGDFAVAFFRNPLGLERAASVEPAILIAANERRGALRAGVAIPEGVAVSFLSTDDERIRQAMLDALSDAGAGLSGDATGYLVFDCAARWASCGRGLTQEIAGAASAAVGDVPVAGMASYGELGRARGPAAFHGSSVSVLAVG